MNVKPWMAFVLSFLIPGAGLAYLGKWGWAAVNLTVVVAIGAMGAMLFPQEFSDYVHYPAVLFAAASAGLAHAVALQMNKRSC
jgi:TM2 domain-containing membrane protein YozV